MSAPSPTAGAHGRVRSPGQALRGHAAMALFAALIAGSFSLGGQAAPHIDPAALNALRFVLAAALMTGVLAAGRRGLRRADFAGPWRFALLGALMAVYFVLMFVALRIASPVSTSAVFTLIPAMSAIFALVLSRQRTRAAAALAMALGAAGALWVIVGGDAQALAALRIGRGEAIFFVGCAAHALYAALAPRLNREEPVMAATVGVLWATAVILLAWAAPALAAMDWAATPPVVWLTLGYLAVFATAVSFFLLQYGTMRLPAGKAMAWGYATPAFVALYEGLAGRGWPAPALLLGVAAIAAALAALAALRD